MRVFILTLAIVCGVAALPAVNVATGAGSVPGISATVLLQAEGAGQSGQATSPAPQQSAPQINVDIHRGGGGRWYANPVWIAIGGVALVVVILLIVMAARGGGGGGTTVVRG